MKRSQNRLASKRRVQPPTSHLPNLPGLSSVNIAKILSNFMTFRSTIKDLSSSLQKMEKMLDSTYQMFEIAQEVMVKKPAKRRSPTRRSRPSLDQEEIPLINLPKDDEFPSGSPIGQLLKHIDPSMLFQIMKSPLVQRMFTQLMPRPKSASARISRKQR